MSKRPLLTELKKSFKNEIKWNNHTYKLVAVKPNSLAAMKREKKIPVGYFTKIVEHQRESVFMYGIYKSTARRFK